MSAGRGSPLSSRGGSPPRVRMAMAPVRRRRPRTGGAGRRETSRPVCRTFAPKIAGPLSLLGVADSTNAGPMTENTDLITGAPHPVRIEGARDPSLSRWLWLVKWLLLLPHLVVLVFLWIAFAVLTVVAWFAILFTARYPRAIFDFNLGVLRWSWRVAFYGYGALGTDRYPPFTLADVPDYPARLDIAHPVRLSRGLALVKWWLLALPHYLVVGFFLGGAGTVAWRYSDTGAVNVGGGLVGLLVFFAGVALLFTARYPAGIFDAVLGMDRWAFRVAAYAALMTDVYPPFQLDQGGAEPAPAPLPPQPTGDSAGAAAPTPEVAAR
jgi:Domain of unknown function (DUF4389)